MRRKAFSSVLVAVALLGGVALAGCAKPATPSESPSSANPTGLTPGGPVLAVKIDNVVGARPATGLSSADVIYVEPVEGGLTRIVAVFSSRLPDLIGPVRSARLTDIQLLGQYGRPTFAYSGSVPQLIPQLHAAPLVNASDADVAAAYVRQGPHAAPHNLYVRPGKLPAGSGPTPQDVLQFGDAPPGGTPTTEQKVGYPAAAYQFRWSAQTQQWQVWMDGTPFTSSESGQLGAATVVLQKVSTTPGPWPEDSSGARAPVAQTIGTGTATVLRGGQAYQANWSRPAEQDPTRFTTSDGQALPLAMGPVWIMLVPA